MNNLKFDVIQKLPKKQYLIMDKEGDRVQVSYSTKFFVFSGELSNPYVSRVQPKYYTSFWKAYWYCLIYGATLRFVNTYEAEDHVYADSGIDTSYSWLRLRSDPKGPLYKVYWTPLGPIQKDNYVYVVGDTLYVNLHQDGCYMLEEFEEVII